MGLVLILQIAGFLVIFHLSLRMNLLLLSLKILFRIFQMLELGLPLPQAEDFIYNLGFQLLFE